MKMRKRTTLIAMTLAMTMFLTACGTKPVENDANSKGGDKGAVVTSNLMFASGGTSGTYYPYANAITKTLENHVEGLSVNVQATGASAENINLIAKDEVDIAIVQNDVMKYAYDGIETFEGKSIQDISTLATVYAEVCQVIVSPNSGIESIADLKGKRVSVGDVGSGVEANAKQILAVYGVDFKDIKKENLGFGPSADAMKDKRIDAFFVTAGVPTTAVMELATTHDIEILSIDKEHADKLKTDYDFYTDFAISKDVYNGLEDDILTIAVKATLIVRPELDEELVYQMTKAIFENKEEVTNGHKKGEELDVQAAVEGVSVPLHPGAERYFKEAGVL